MNKYRLSIETTKNAIATPAFRLHGEWPSLKLCRVDAVELWSEFDSVRTIAIIGNEGELVDVFDGQWESAWRAER